MLTVKDLDGKSLHFVSDSQDVNAIRQHLGLIDPECDSYFVKVENGEYTEVYGIEGIVPYLSKSVIKII